MLSRLIVARASSACLRPATVTTTSSTMTYSDLMGSGSGRGGGSGGSVRDAGGKFGEMEAAHENEYFYKLQKEQLKNLKASHEHEIGFHEQQIAHHKAMLERHQKSVDEVHKEHENLGKK